MFVPQVPLMIPVTGPLCKRGSTSALDFDFPAEHVDVMISLLMSWRPGVDLIVAAGFYGQGELDVDISVERVGW